MNTRFKLALLETLVACGFILGGSIVSIGNFAFRIFGALLVAIGFIALCEYGKLCNKLGSAGLLVIPVYESVYRRFKK